MTTAGATWQGLARNRLRTRFLPARALLVPALAVGWAPAAIAEIRESDDSGFISAHEVEIEAPPERVFDALVAEIGAWWDPAHTYSGDASNMAFDQSLALRERLPDAGIVHHLRVDMMRPPKMLRLSGGLGPLQSLGVAASMTFQLESTLSGTALRYRYVVNGRSLRDWAEPVDRVMGRQLERLRRYVETGSPIAGEASDDEADEAN